MANRVFGNRYQVTEKIGMGGMAEVFKANDSTLGRTVAVKVMLPQYAADENFAARFRQEAQAAANLTSPYIVNIYDWGKDGNSYYIVMEYVRGTDLKTAIQQRGHIHPRKVAEIGAQVCSALSVAHGYDIIHRDIKSANIMVQADGNVKVMDFGIAQAGKPDMTQDSSVLGTAHYVSPEQAQGKRLAPTSDLYSLGIVLYEAATGQLPFDGSDVVSVAMKQVSEMPVPPRQINPDIDPRFEAIIMRALAKNPEDRFQTANEMKRAIEDYLTGRDTGDATQVLGETGSYEDLYAGTTRVLDPASSRTVAVDASGGDRKPPKKKGKIIAAVVIVALLVAAGLIAAFATGLIGKSDINVPNVVGMTEEQATKTIEEAGLQVGTSSHAASDTVEEGLVIEQDPKANTSVARDSKVNLVISEGKNTKMVAVPNLAGLTADQAEEALSEAGLKGEAQQGYSDAYEPGKIFGQNPAAFTQVAEGTTVAYTISQGQETETVTVPNLRGVDAGDAQATLESMGLVVQLKDGKSDELGEGQVCEQSIAGGTKVSTGTTIVLTIVTGSTSTNVPDVVGSSEASATATLKNAGFTVDVKYSTGTKNTVISQSPTGGTSAQAGDTVSITVGTGEDEMQLDSTDNMLGQE